MSILTTICHAQKPEVFGSEPFGTTIFENQIGPAAVADFNRDGLDDLAVTTLGDNTVYVIMAEAGNALGEPRKVLEPSNQFLSSGPLHVGDTNGDGIPDLILGNVASVMVLLGNGDGQFTQKLSYQIGSKEKPFRAAGIAVGDLNNDGRTDVVGHGVRNVPGVSIAFANSDGSYSVSSFVKAPQAYPGIAVGDVTRDGIADIVGAGQDWLVLFENQGAGSFSEPKGLHRPVTNSSEPSQPVIRHGSVKLIDADADGTSEHVLVRGGSGRVRSIEFYSVVGGELVFAKGPTVGYGRTPGIFQLADLDGDGYIDLSAGTYIMQRSGTPRVEVETGWGQVIETNWGTKGVAVGSFPNAGKEAAYAVLRLGDVNGDRKLDAILIHAAPVPGRSRKMTTTGFATIGVLPGLIENATPSAMKPVVQPSASQGITIAPTPAPKPQITAGSHPASPTERTAVPEWELVGLWTYDARDAQLLPSGFVLVEAPGELGPASWTHRLELRDHSRLSARPDRIVWPVKINRRSKRVCVDGPYPTYEGEVNLPGGAFDGTYTFASCKGGP